MAFSQAGDDDVTALAPALTELPPLRGFAHEALVTELASRFTVREFRTGQTLAVAGRPVDTLWLIAHGKVDLTGQGKYDDHAVNGHLADGHAPRWKSTARAATPVIALSARASEIRTLIERDRRRVE